MNKTAYMEIKKQLAFDKPLWATFAVIAFDLALLLFAFYLLALHDIWAYFASQCLLTLVYFHNFALLHECGHENVHAKRWVNNTIGHYVSIFCFMPFFPWKFIHQQHHLWTGNIDKDPTMQNVRTIREKGRVSPLIRWTWYAWIPLSALWQHVVFWLYPLTMWKEGRMTRDAFWKSSFSVLWLAFIYGMLFHFLPGQVNLANLWLSFVLYLIVTELVNFPHHLAMPTFHTSESLTKLHPWQQHLTTRSCYYPYGLALLTLNFNLHTEHHYFPGLPWFRLPKLRHILKTALGSHYNESVGIGWNLKNRLRDPADILLSEIPLPALE